MISLDTLRRDAVGAFVSDASPSPTPRLDAFSTDAVRFLRASSPMPFTLASHMSVFTGLHPFRHGVVGRDRRLATDVATLPQELQRHGYRTLGVVTNEWLDADFGFARGFERYEKLPHRLTFAERVNRRGLELIDEATEAGDRPWFLFLHYLDPHSDPSWTGDPVNRLPYYSPPPYAPIDSADSRFCVADACATDFLLAADRGDVAPSGDQRAVLDTLYRAGVRALDAALGDLFEQLRRRGVYDRALIVVLSDHGEELGEHGGWLHSRTFEESLAVPLAIRFPGGRHSGAVDDRSVSLVDVLPTVLDYLRLEPSPASDGVSLMPEIEGASDAAPRRILAQDKLVRTRWALRDGRYKLIRDRASGATSVYDLESDPGETRDLAGSEPQLARRLVGELDAILGAPGRRDAFVAPDDMSDAEKARLESLGYLQ